MSKAGKYIRRDQWRKVNANRKRLQDARDLDEREQEAIRLLNRAKETGSSVFIMEQVEPERGDIVGQYAASILRVTKISR